MQLDLKQITFYVINEKDDYERKAIIQDRLNKLGLKHVFVPGVVCEPNVVGQSLSRLKILENTEFRLPFVIINDYTDFKEPLQYIYQLPENVDALYLGQSRFGIEKTGEFSWGKFNNIHFEAFNELYIRLLNNLAGHAILYVSERYRKQAIEANLNALLRLEHPYPGSIEYAILQKDFLVLSPISNPSFQNKKLGGNQVATQDSLFELAKTHNFTNVYEVNQPNDFELLEKNGDKFYLFYDIFIHWNLLKITAVAPHYDQDADLSEFHQEIFLSTGDLTIKGHYIPCELDSWEPSIIIDFEHPDLAKIISNNYSIDITIKCAGLSKKYQLIKFVPRYEISMSVIIKDENRWIGFYLDYYLNVMKANHVYVYDNRTKDVDQLIEIVKPYVAKSQATLIPWHYRWRNHKDRKQIGQPPQETHTLNKFGHGNWVGFFDVDEFLKIPGSDLQRFMSHYNPRKVGGISFGLRWFFYKGPKNFNQIDNPLIEYIHCKKDELGRKRQKLMVSPKLARYAGFHWIPKELKEIKIDDTDIFFHHYYIKPKRFMEGKRSQGTIDRSMQQLYSDRTKMEKLEFFIDDCLLIAKNEESILPKTVLDQNGIPGLRAKHFYNRLSNLNSSKILCIGNFNAFLFNSLVFKNFFSITCIYQLEKSLENETKFLENIRKHSGAARIKLLNQDWRETKKRDLDQYNVFLYHGEVEYESVFNALTLFAENLEDFTIIVIENWNNESVRNATNAAFKGLNGQVFFNREIILNEEDTWRLPNHNGKQTWWNGIGIFGLNFRNVPIVVA